MVEYSIVDRSIRVRFPITAHGATPEETTLYLICYGVLAERLKHQTVNLTGNHGRFDSYAPSTMSKCNRSHPERAFEADSNPVSAPGIVREKQRKVQAASGPPAKMIARYDKLGESYNF